MGRVGDRGRGYKEDNPMRRRGDTGTRRKRDKEMRRWGDKKQMGGYGETEREKKK